MGFSSGAISDSEAVLVKEAGMDGSFDGFAHSALGSGE
jgi:hypothetical protein